MRVIQSIQRAIDIISCFDENNHKLSLQDISTKLDLNINTTRGIVNTLLYNGYLEHDSLSNEYSLGLIFIPKADLIYSNKVDRIKSIATPHLNDLANKYQVSARLQLISNYNIFTVLTINPENARYILLTNLNVAFPLNATSSGKLYLYYLNDEDKEKYLNSISDIKYTDKTIIYKNDLIEELNFIETHGYSKEFEEIGMGISSIASPILNDKNELIGTISVTASTPIIEKTIEDIVKDFSSINENIKDILLFI